MSMSNQSQTERTRVIMIPSAIYSFKTTVKTSYSTYKLYCRGETSALTIKRFHLKEIRLGIILETKKWDKGHYECFYIYKCHLSSKLSQLFEHLFQRTSLVKVGQFGPFARMKVFFFFFFLELTTNTTTFSTFVTLKKTWKSWNSFRSK